MTNCSGSQERGELLKDGNVEKQIARMVKDSRSRALVENFAGQWLQLHNLYDVDPDPKKFPKFSYQLREDMKRETLAFVRLCCKKTGAFSISLTPSLRSSMSGLPGTTESMACKETNSDAWNLRLIHRAGES
jgi:hypothetical protein